MTFTAVTDPSIAAYGWDLNDNGSYGDATGPEIRRTFRDVRTYEIGLQTVDDQGAVSQRRKAVTVVADRPPTSRPRPPSSSSPRGPVAGELITFVSTSTDADSPIPASALDWDLNGDGVFDDARGAECDDVLPGGRRVHDLASHRHEQDRRRDAGPERRRPRHPRDRCRATGALSDEPVPGVRISGQILAPRRPDPATDDRRPARHRRSRCVAAGGAARSSGCAGPSPCALRANRELPPTRLLRIRTLEGRLLRPGRQAETVRHASRCDREIHAIRDSPAQVPHPRRPVPGARERPPAFLPLAVIAVAAAEARPGPPERRPESPPEVKWGPVFVDASRGAMRSRAGTSRRRLLRCLTALAAVGALALPARRARTTPTHSRGGSGTGSGELFAPGGIDTDSLDNVYVADFANDRIQNPQRRTASPIEFGFPGQGPARRRGRSTPPATIYVANQYADKRPEVRLGRACKSASRPVSSSTRAASQRTPTITSMSPTGATTGCRSSTRPGMH